MITDTLRALAEILRDPATGLNTVLATVPMDVGDLAPEPVSIHEETTSNAVAGGAIPDELLKLGPVVALHNYGTATVDTTAGRGTTETPLQVLIRFVSTPSSDSDDAADVARAYATLRAIQFTISRAFAAARRDYTDIERNGVTLDEPTSFEPTQLSREGAVVVGLIVTVPVHDPWARAGL